MTVAVKPTRLAHLWGTHVSGCRANLTAFMARHLPAPIAVAPERVLINALCVLVGLSVILPPDVPSALWPRHVAVGWALVMILGGVSAMVGFWSSAHRTVPWATSLERVGFLALFVATIPYGIRLIDVAGWRGVPVGMAFIAIGIAKGLRLLMSTAARDQVLASGNDSEATKDAS